ncbi:hypothetical protein [Dethiothermospora halolimnae]|uniref:hypothetical protein n=1 Tax=Dethiothermospora halolimnae TaxID=3114390 RepID=UPI003CCC0889
MKKGKVEVNGKEYELQSLPYKKYLELLDQCNNKYGVLQQAAYAEKLYKYCVINPKVTSSDFDEDFKAGLQLVEEIERFLGMQ